MRRVGRGDLWGIFAISGDGQVLALTEGAWLERHFLSPSPSEDFGRGPVRHNFHSATLSSCEPIEDFNRGRQPVPYDSHLQLPPPLDLEYVPGKL